MLFLQHFHLTQSNVLSPNMVLQLGQKTWPCAAYTALKRQNKKGILLHKLLLILYAYKSFIFISVYLCFQNSYCLAHCSFLAHYMYSLLLLFKNCMKLFMLFDIAEMYNLLNSQIFCFLFFIILFKQINVCFCTLTIKHKSNSS